MISTKGWRKSALRDIMAGSTRKADYEKKNQSR